MEQIKGDCPCKKKNCEKHGKCGECREYHRLYKKNLPVCERRDRREERKGRRV